MFVFIASIEGFNPRICKRCDYCFYLDKKTDIVFQSTHL